MDSQVGDAVVQYTIKSHNCIVAILLIYVTLLYICFRFVGATIAAAAAAAAIFDVL